MEKNNSALQDSKFQFMYLNCLYTFQNELLPNTNDTEKQLLLQLSEGSESALQQLFYKYHHLIGAFVFKLTRSRELAEEIVQDVFLKLWTCRHSSLEIRNLKSWLFTLSRNQALNALRSQLKEKQAKEYLESLPISESYSQEDLTQNDRFKQIDEAIRLLPPQQQKVFLMSRYQRLKYEEIAHKMNISRETVKSYLQNATSSITRFLTRQSI